MRIVIIYWSWIHFYADFKSKIFQIISLFEMTQNRIIERMIENILSEFDRFAIMVARDGEQVHEFCTDNFISKTQVVSVVLFYVFLFRGRLVT